AGVPHREHERSAEEWWQMKLLVATHNRGKAVEIAELLAGLPVQVVTLADIAPELDTPETGSTFAENARQKALAASAATGLLTLADDSGLAVDALDGAPGVYSKRFALDDEQRVAKMLQLLHDLPVGKRTAAFHCAVCLADANGVVAELEATAPGIIIDIPRGTNGFGYDPIFQPDGFTITMAEMSMAEKNAISHRGKAFRQAAEILRGIL
ncbi:MAG: RdgB/HAM1 family non-canonical purine NTP pyrophosphatase, partial [bacterium]